MTITCVKRRKEAPAGQYEASAVPAALRGRNKLILRGIFVIMIHYVKCPCGSPAPRGLHQCQKVT